ncbi:acetate--CoA ligase family protein [Sulfitobacter sp. W074]|uniref:acetate--CoA ligase family protein n=1 Tax=Sulfitobacter sp. W074 TaxID=2867026 RepID=UPI0021A4413F|nr:acetate--CoA ligase family protein [Sulfitobacter sp. W074]UWR39503.1 acetate--CoA ligase family protein [Sulfitobacter sp. W074]
MTNAMPFPGTGLDAFFKARGIAIVGASGDINKIGGRPVHLLRKYGYAEPIYPVNPKGGEIQGLSVYTSVLDLPTTPDMAVLAVPAAATAAALRDCVARGVKAVIVLSSGFAEAGEEGAALQQKLVEIARAGGVRLMGPNCLGTISVIDGAIGSFSIVLEENMPAKGNVGIVSQSGNIGSYLVQKVTQRQLGVSRFIATGNEADVDVADGIAALAEDEHTRVILCCMETCRSAARLIDALAVARAKGKPVIVLKIGATERGQAAAASHTGALAGSDAVIDAVFRRHGALRVHSIEDLLDVGHATSQLMPGRLPAGNRLTLVAASGGFGIMMADAASRIGFTLPELSESTKAMIRDTVPTAGTENPVDASAQMSSRPDILFKMLSALMEEANTDATLLFLSLSLNNARLRKIYVEALTKIRASYPERLLVIAAAGPADAVAEIRMLGIPVFPSIDSAMSGMDGLVRLHGQCSAPHTAAAPIAAEPLDPAAFRNEYNAKQALLCSGVEVLPETVVTSAEEAAEKAQAFGFPVVLKIVSADIPHKTEIGGVMLNLAHADAVRAAYAEIMAAAAEKAPAATIDGVLVTPMAGKGVELIMGISRDPVFGPVAMVGIGGIYAEVLQDVQVQTAPLSENEALAMIRSLRMFPVLDGARGMPLADVQAAAKTLARLSEFAIRHADKVAEVDLNPVLVREQGQGVVALDALLIPVSPSA